MQQFFKYFLLLGVCLTALGAHAHLMPAQKGSLNLTDQGAFLVLSLPISAFDNIDSNADGKVTLQEYKSAQKRISAQAREHIGLSTDRGNYALIGVMLAPETGHGSDSVEQINVMGKFSIGNDYRVLVLKNAMYGTAETEKTVTITATRKASNWRRKFDLSESRPYASLYP